MADHLDAFALEQRRRGLNTKTIKNRLRRVERLEAFIGHSALEATEDEVQAFLDDQAVCARSRSTYLSHLASFYRFARRHYGTPDPTLDIHRPRVPRLLPRPIAEDDLEHALNVAKPQMRAWLALGAYEGLRCMEIAGLSREDVRDREPLPLLFVSGKGGNERLLPLNPFVLSVLRVYGMPRRGRLFSTRFGNAYSGGTVSKEISRFLHNEGIDATAHQLRHYFATTVYQRTHDLRLVQELLGHRDPKTTTIYAAFDPQQAAAVVGMLGPGTLRPVRTAP
jgi:integrase